MATHDYIISNASGASVRADLNNALAAIVSNNSNATSPATTYAYQWWADTTTGQLKLRNSANNAWITIFELDGTMLMEDGTVSAPGLAFASDLNTGFFRSAADKINFATGGAERLEIGSSEVVFNDPSNDVDFRVESNGNTHMLFVDAGNDAVGIGTSTPSGFNSVADDLVVSSSGDTGITINAGTSSSANVFFADSDGNSRGQIRYFHGSDALSFAAGGSDAMRIDSSGRLLVGTTTAVGTSNAVIIKGTSGVSNASIYLGNTANASTLVAGNTLGFIEYGAADGGTGAQVLAAADGTWSSTSDCPTRLVFSTAADSSGSPTERMRINSTGNVKLTGGEAIFWDDAGDRYIACIGDSTSNINLHGRANVIFKTGGSSYDSGSEAARFDSVGRLLVGHSSSRSVDAQMFVQIEGTTQQGSSMSLVRNSNDAAPPNIVFGKSRGTSTGSDTVVQSGDNLGIISFNGADGTDLNTGGASIKVEVDGTPGSNDMPGRFVFSTTADGASSPTERVRIRSNGQVEFKNGSFSDNIDCVMANSGTMEIGAQTEIKFRTATNERMRVTDNGLTFNGDTAAANALDDYEEGTWTPSSVDNFNGITNAEGQYEKIGKVVTVVFQFNYSSLDSSSSSSGISGLPFTVANHNSGTGVEATSVVFGTNKHVIAYANSGSTNVYFQTDEPLYGSASTGSDFFRGNITYLAA